MCLCPKAWRCLCASVVMYARSVFPKTTPTPTEEGSSSATTMSTTLPRTSSGATIISRRKKRSHARPLKRRWVGRTSRGNERKRKPVKPTVRGSVKGFARQKLLDPRRYAWENSPDVLSSM
uniref:Uncharacterized protein n=1 Tax=Leersia perrieri TaxID=77586 RepID=A0A0D9XBE4_9ORYZ